MPTYLPAIKL